MGSMVSIATLFAEAGITPEEFKRYFLDPLAIEQSAALETQFVSTANDDDDAQNLSTSDAVLEGLLAQPELLLNLPGHINVEKLLDILTQAQPSKAKLLKEKLQQAQKLRSAKQETSQAAHEKEKQQRNASPSAPPPVDVSTLRRAAAAVIGAVSSMLGSAANALLPRRRTDENEQSGRSRRAGGFREGRRRPERSAQTQAEDIKQSVKQETKKLAVNLNILDAVYDRKAIIDAMRERIGVLESGKDTSPEEKKQALLLAQLLQKPEQIKAMKFSENGQVLTVEHNESKEDLQARKVSVIRMVGRLGMLRERVAKIVEESKDAMHTQVLNKALKEAGGVSLGTGGQQADGIARTSSTERQQDLAAKTGPKLER